jgi:16S rRNA (cytidine1402-2'-O)-methyltransferase
MTGTLYIVGTPLGNLSDMSPRAAQTLMTVDLIAAEDTRHTGILLKDQEITTPQTSYHDFNKHTKAPYLVELLKSGKRIALVSDAGMPGISDPGYLLVKSAIEAGIPVVPIPGPSAVTTALSVSGLPTDRFVFEGFLPRKPSHRRKHLEALKEEPRTLVFYESPHRLTKTLQDVREIFGNRRLCVCREMTKKFEEILHVSVEDAIIHFTEKKLPKGEFTLVIAGAET